MSRHPELLIPASSLEVLKTAVIFGADAVYIGGEAFGLRAKAKNFSMEDMKEGIEFAHAHDVKVYVTANILAHNDDLEGVREYFEELKEIKPDALIIADPGVFEIAKEVCPEIERHVSTQANNTNYATYNFWYKQGASRVVSARELSMKELKELRANIPEDLEIETFVHGAMCISYSGRCLLSNYFTGRDANQGACTHPCRWKYAVVEETRPGEYMPVYENERGTYIFNSKDLCMIEYIPELIDAGIDSLKIEGRMKSEFYVASVVKAYREALDSYWENPNNYKFKDEWMDMLRKVSHRPYHTGFYLGINGEQNYDDAGYVRDYEIVGMVKSYDPETKTATVLQKNRVFEGDEVEVLRPDVPYFKIKLEDMYDLDKNKKTDVANRAHMMFKVKVNEPLKVNDMIVKANNTININNN